MKIYVLINKICFKQNLKKENVYIKKKNDT